VAQGDQGAYDDSNELGSTDLDIDNPGDSPYTTSAGGTTLPGDIPLTSTDTAHIKAERAWGWDWLWPHYLSFGAQSEAQFAFAEAVGTGGGYSKDLPRPSYQKTVPGLGSFRDVLYLTPVRPAPFGTLTLPSAWQFSQPQGVGTGKNSFGRGVPDVSTDADPFTGYLFWFEGGPLAGGGTSFVAPQLNGSTAVIDQMVGHRVGFWNPRIYRWATQSRSPFRPLSAASASNDNLYYTGSPGRVWNPASGLGTPNLTALARDFAR
jgi:subtilase family serine protease